MITAKSTLYMKARTQRRALESPWRIHRLYSGVANGNSRAEVTLNSEKIKPVALAIVKLRESEGIRQADKQLS